MLFTMVPVSCETLLRTVSQSAEVISRLILDRKKCHWVFQMCLSALLEQRSSLRSQAQMVQSHSQTRNGHSYWTKAGTEKLLLRQLHSSVS